MKTQLVLLGGDGIGPEVISAARSVIEAINTRFNHQITTVDGLIGGAAIDATGAALPPETVSLCENTDAVLLGAVGGPKWSDPDASERPELGLLRLRALLGVYANIRPVKPLPDLYEASPIKADRLKGTDILVVRELTGGIYFGDKSRDEFSATDVCRYTVEEIERIARRAGELAKLRRGEVSSIDKANVLETSRLWRQTVERVFRDEFPELKLEHVLVDAAAMHLIDRPADFDVLVTENMFGDILTDEASMLAGSLGLLPSASLGDGLKGLYEPIHGSAPDIAGQGIANPCATIASLAMLFRHSLELGEEADAIEAAIALAIASGARTADIASGNDEVLSTSAMTTRIVGALNAA